MPEEAVFEPLELIHRNRRQPCAKQAASLATWTTQQKSPGNVV